MCLAIAKPAGKFIPVDYLEEGFKSNPHGAGIAYAKHGRLTIEKGFFTIGELLATWKEVEHLDALIHFRWATTARIDTKNCHPWKVSNRTAMIHNGILPFRSTDSISDTGCFVIDEIRPNLGRLNDDAYRAMLGEMIGAGNKLAFINHRGTFKFVNEAQGHWEDGIWYSNHSYLPWLGGRYTTEECGPATWNADDWTTMDRIEGYATELLGFMPDYCTLEDIAELLEGEDLSRENVRQALRDLTYL